MSLGFSISGTHYSCNISFNSEGGHRTISLHHLAASPHGAPSTPKPYYRTHKVLGGAHFGLTTDVVRDPLSTYTPEKYQSSAPVPSLPCRGNLRTPKCQSAPLLDVLAEKGPAVLTSVLLPVECQKVTCCEPKF